MEEQSRCAICSKDPKNRNNAFFECSHVDCPHRRHAWSERPTPEQLYKGPWAKNEDKDPKPLA